MPTLYSTPLTAQRTQCPLTCHTFGSGHVFQLLAPLSNQRQEKSRWAGTVAKRTWRSWHSRQGHAFNYQIWHSGSNEYTVLCISTYLNNGCYMRWPETHPPSVTSFWLWTSKGIIKPICYRRLPPCSTCDRADRAGRGGLSRVRYRGPASSSQRIWAAAPATPPKRSCWVAAIASTRIYGRIRRL